MNRCSFCEWIPILPWPVCPLAGHARLGQNTVVGSMTILLSWLCWGACQEEVCLDPRCLCNLTLPRFSAELPSDRRRGRGRREFTSFPSCLGTSGRTRRGESKGLGRTHSSPSRPSQGHGNALPPQENRMASGLSLQCVRKPYGR